MIYRKLTHIPQKKQKKNKIHQYIPRTHTHTRSQRYKVCVHLRESESRSAKQEVDIIALLGRPTFR